MINRGIGVLFTSKYPSPEGMIYANAIGKIRNPNTRLPGLSYPIPVRDIGKATTKQLPLHDTSTQVAGRSKLLFRISDFVLRI